MGSVLLESVLEFSFARFLFVIGPTLLLTSSLVRSRLGSSALDRFVIHVRA